jgi:hypothetical protein
MSASKLPAAMDMSPAYQHLKQEVRCLSERLVVRGHPGLDSVHPVKAGAGAVNSAGVAVVDVILLVLTIAPPVQLVVEDPEPRVEAALQDTATST